MNRLHGYGIRVFGIVLVVLVAFGAPLGASAAADDATPTSLSVPRLDRAPTLDDFAGMTPRGGIESDMARVDGFVQRAPSDGEAASQRTEAYLGYDREYLYVVFLAFDSESDKVRARLVPREQTEGDDTVTVELDTFADERRAYGFSANPLGVQTDFFETSDATRDLTFDTIWSSKGVVTERGYIVMMSIPFTSLRFPSGTNRPWGIVLERSIPRSSETSFWPRVSASVPNVLSQAAELRGIEGVAPGRNVQIIPYGSFRSTRALDTRDPAHVAFTSERAALDSGVDAKLVLGGRFVVDATLNPDFSQVESDDPQATANARFALFVPERRPFFVENADFFQTPMQLVFTRRIADPQLGVRITGKTGPYSIGAMVIDDQSPGRIVPDDDPDAGTRATFAVVRASRDILDESRVGVLYTERRFEGGFNRVAAFDSRLKLASQWSLDLQAAASATRDSDGNTLAGPAYRAFLRGKGRHYVSETTYSDLSANFRAETGFIPRVDLRAIEHYSEAYFYPEGKRLLVWSFGGYVGRRWDHSGTLLEKEYDVGGSVELRGQTVASLWRAMQRDGFRPVDYPTLPALTVLPHDVWVANFRSRALRQISVVGKLFFGGTDINYSPATGAPPATASRPFDGNLTLTVQPSTRLRVDSTYLFDRLRDRQTGSSIFNSHIVRSKCNWQFTRELSVRGTVQYEALRVNPAFTALDRREGFNADLLVTYLVNPWTALHVGYNGDLQNIDLVDGADGRIARRGERGLLDDSRRFFVKFSYLIRP